MTRTITLRSEHLVRSHSFNVNVSEADRKWRIRDCFTDDNPHLSVKRDGVKIVHTEPPETKGINTMERVWAVVVARETVEVPDAS